MKAQVTLTVAEGKELIATAIVNRADVRAALASGKVLLKGGTTVAAVAEKLIGEGLRISGRISRQGAKSASRIAEQPHSVILENGQVTNIDEDFAEAVATLRPGDVAIIGANAVDGSGRAALMLGRVLGGKVGQGLAGLMSQGCKVIIACGLEKLIPGSIDTAIQEAGIYAADWSMGMAVGLTPLIGEVVSEPQAATLLADVRCTVIGSGGIEGAEGACTMLIDGEETEIAALMKRIVAIKGMTFGGIDVPECSAGSPNCSLHQACAWRRVKKGGRLEWYEK